MIKFKKNMMYAFAFVVSLLWCVSIATAQIGFDDSDPIFMRLWNTTNYEVTIQKTDGRILSILDITTGQTVSPGNAMGPWKVKFSDSTWLEGQVFSPTNPSRQFSYAWDAGTSRLNL